MYVIRNGDTGRFAAPAGIGVVYTADLSKAALYSSRAVAQGDCFGSDRVLTLKEATDARPSDQSREGVQEAVQEEREV